MGVIIGIIICCIIDIACIGIVSKDVGWFKKKKKER